MFVNRVAVLIIVSRNIYHGTVDGMTSMKIPVVDAAIQNIVKLYAIRIFWGNFIFVDLQFKAIKDRNNIRRAIINVVSRNEDDKDIEQYIQVVEEHARYC